MLENSLRTNQLFDEITMRTCLYGIPIEEVSTSLELDINIACMESACVMQICTGIT